MSTDRFRPDFPPLSQAHATLLMVSALVTAATYYEITNIKRCVLENMLVNALPDNDYAQRAALAWFDKIEAEYDTDARTRPHPSGGQDPNLSPHQRPGRRS